ncbi:MULTISPECIES: YnfU family zinc-binding protein [Erwiniaceae]|nr:MULTISPECIES: YnfU family zinc-binding protein [Erwiniaceae]MDF2043823.1 YnfU family zinc-binding protein [Pantoea sp. Cr_R14]MDF2069822.1 YnfU family zinc-binding protein [Pantoea sp. Cr_R13]MDF2081425.1 YnfU family zinc-binding protein [Pantoea sp. Cr_R21]
MSLLSYARKLMSGTSRVVCPACGLRSDQPASKVRLKQAMLCPGCKALFVSPQ